MTLNLNKAEESVIRLLRLQPDIALQPQHLIIPAKNITNQNFTFTEIEAACESLLSKELVYQVNYFNYTITRAGLDFATENYPLFTVLESKDENP